MIEEVKNEFLKTEYLHLPNDKGKQDIVFRVCKELQAINDILEDINAQVAYRVRDELASYMIINEREKLLDENKAMDYEILQKILPRLQGSSIGLKKTLCKLFELFATKDFDGENVISSVEVAEEMEKALTKAKNNNACKYPRSAKKVVEMVRRFEEDGFTSYWTWWIDKN